ncbi:MAG: hypothetical protein WAV25_00115 [Minisyncoccia bacterium]
MKKSLLFASFIVFALLLIVHLVGIKFYFYWDSRWYDNTAHFLGGLSVSLLSLWILFVSGIFGKHKPTKKQILFASILCGALIGIGWEIFEYIYGIAAPIGSYWADTSYDFISDLVGSSVAYLIASKKEYYEPR